MTTNTSGPRTMRLRRLYRHGPHGLLVTPLDHTLASGPVTPQGWSLDDLVTVLTAGGSDAVVLHKGAVRHVEPEHLADVSLVVHLNGSTASAADPDAKVLLTSVEEAIRLGADAVSLHVNFGSETEEQQLHDLAEVAEACDRWNLPLLAMVYPRGPAVSNPTDPDLLLHAVTVAADLGADLVKTAAPDDVAVTRELAESCPVPLLLAGGPPRADVDELTVDVRQALAGGVGGLAIGRALFRADDPRRATAAVAALIHQRPGLVATSPTHHGATPPTHHIATPPTHQEGESHDDDQAVLA